MTRLSLVASPWLVRMPLGGWNKSCAVSFWVSCSGGMAVHTWLLPVTCKPWPSICTIHGQRQSECSANAPELVVFLLEVWQAFVLGRVVARVTVSGTWP